MFKGDKNISLLVTVVSIVTTTVFTLEVCCKIIAEGFEPWVYFTDTENGKFNTLDFSIVMAGYAFMGMQSGGAIGVLRMLRLVRLLTFIKGVPQLRAIIAGLVKGMQSVTYIVMLLVLIIYLFAIMGVLFFGANDPARFGSVANAMITLFQVSTLASWTSIAYTSWYGCGNYNGDPYASAMDDDPESVIHTSAGILQGFKCMRDYMIILYIHPHKYNCVC
jgi:voltage-gated sodium channel